MMTLQDLSNKAIREFLACSNVHASDIKAGRKPVPKAKREAFSKRFNIPVEHLANSINRDHI